MCVRLSKWTKLYCFKMGSWNKIWHQRLDETWREVDRKGDWFSSVHVTLRRRVELYWAVGQRGLNQKSMVKEKIFFPQRKKKYKTNKKHSESADTSTSVTFECDVDLMTRLRTLKLSNIMLRFDKLWNQSFCKALSISLHINLISAKLFIFNLKRQLTFRSS